MELREYQKQAVNCLLKGIQRYKKVRLVIPAGLGRYYIIAEAAVQHVNRGKRVLILVPEKYKCFRVRDLCLERSGEDVPALSFGEYKGGGLLITTYSDFEKNFSGLKFDLIICDGLYWGKEQLTELAKKRGLRFAGFTSQNREKERDFFSDSKKVFQYTLEEAIRAGYPVSGYEFTAIVFKIFQALKYEVHLPEKKDFCDLTADGMGESLAIEIKTWSSRKIGIEELKRTAGQMVGRAENGKRKLVLVTNSIVENRQRDILKKIGPVLVLDSRNLLYLVRGNIVLESMMRGFLHYTTENVSPEPPQEMQIGLLAETEENDQVKNLIERFKRWEPEKEKPADYEKLCCRALKYLFKDELTLWQEQKKSNDDLFRFDLVCKIKSYGSDTLLKKDFWEMAERFFHTKYIIFEFKNYKDEITQKEIYTTEKYLYRESLRRIAIMISASGTSRNAKKAIRGSLRENGKVILSLDNQDMIEMLELKMEGEDATGYLSSKLDELLVELEK